MDNQSKYFLESLGFKYQTTLNVERLFPTKEQYQVVYYDRGLRYSTLTKQWTLESDNLKLELKNSLPLIHG